MLNNVFSCSKLRISFLNINSIGNKMEDECVVKEFEKSDIVGLCDINTACLFSVAGFHVIRSKLIDHEENRGGVIICVRHHIYGH